MLFFQKVLKKIDIVRKTCSFRFGVHLNIDGCMAHTAERDLYEMSIQETENSCFPSHSRYYEGESIIPCNHLYSLHMGAFIQRWQFLHQV